MEILHQDPPENQRRSYGAVIKALRSHPETWLLIEPDQVAGRNPHDKQCSLRQAAGCAGIPVVTTTRGGGLYVRSAGVTGVQHGE